MHEHRPIDVDHVIGKDFAAVFLGILTSSLEQLCSFIFIVENITEFFGPIMEVIVEDGSLAPYLAGLGRIFADDQCATALSVDELVDVS